MTRKQTVKQKAKEAYKQIVFNLSANNNPFFLSFYKYFYKPKPGSLASFTNYFSRKNKPVTVVQIGANDGFNHDPIHKFIKRDAWRGVLVEPQKEVYENYLKKLHAKSEAIKTVNAALDYKDGSSTIYKISFSNARWATGLTTFNRAMMEKAVVSEHVKSCAKKEGVELPKKPEDRFKEEKIPTISPKSLLQKFKINKIDWLQIDVEGFDYEVIKMFDIPSTKPKVIVFEQYSLSDADKKECYHYLQQNNYRIKEYGRDTLAVQEPANEYEAFL